MTRPRYRKSLPELGNTQLLTDGGIETTLIFHDGLDLPLFAAFTLLRTKEGQSALRRYYESHIGVARAQGIGLILDSATWRASRVWRAQLGYDARAPGEAIREVDADPSGGPSYYMINCAHPDHFRSALRTREDWPLRIRGLRANALRKSHAELDEAETLDAGDAKELGRDYAGLLSLLQNLRVFGGCCGTDHRHIHEIAQACIPAQVT